LKRIIVLVLSVFGAAAVALATPAGPGGAPEIDANSAVTALTLLSGSVLLIRGRRK
jgi:hypothetical protein